MVKAGSVARCAVLAISLAMPALAGAAVAAADSGDPAAAAREPRTAAARPDPPAQARASSRTRVIHRVGGAVASRPASAARRSAQSVSIPRPIRIAATGRATARRGITALLFNQSPAIRATLGEQNGDGVVPGVLEATDRDSAPLTFTVSTKPSHGTVTLGPDGVFAYTPDSSVSATGTTDLFRVTASDAGTGFHIHGLIGLINLISLGLLGDPRHNATTTVNVVVTPFAGPTPDDGLSTFCGCTLMPANSVFHADVRALPVLAGSRVWTTLIGGNLSAAWGGDPWMNTTAGMPVNVAVASLPTERVIFNRGLVSSGPTIDDRPYAIPDRPLVEGMPNVPAWDRHLLVLREGSCVSQELYNVANGVELPANGVGDALANSLYASQYGSTWLAEAGVQFDLNSALYPLQGEANASQLPFMPLILRPDDLTRGSIDHMLGIVVAKDRGTGYSWPALSGDGTGTNPNGVPMGTVFRLRADFDESSFDASTRVVLGALKEHGAVVYDSWGAGQDGARLLAMSNGWTGTGYLTAQRELSTIPFSAFEAVDVLTLAVDPSAGWAIRT